MIDNLITLDISQNALRSLPTDFILPNLAVLSLAGNRLEATDTLALIARMCPKLNRLDLSLNHLTSLEGIADLLIGSSRVGELLLAGNQISSLDPLVDIAKLSKDQSSTVSCKTIDLSDNAIARLQPELGWLPLDILSVSGNTFRIPHRRVWEEGRTKGLLKWLQERIA